MYKRTKIIAVANQKGGVGKTATSSALAYGLQGRGYKTILIDGDGQCNSSDAYQAKIEGQATVYDLMNKSAEIKEAIQETKYINIIAGDYLLKQADKHFNDTGREFLLKEALEPIQNQYDFIIIDTIPGLGVMLTNALTAADYVVVPMGADRDSLQGLSQLSIVINQVIQYSNPSLKVLGFLITRAKQRSNLLKEVRSVLPDIEKYLNTKTFNAIVRENIHVQDARASFMPIIEYQKQNRDKNVIAVEDYEDFIDELLSDLSMSRVRQDFIE